MNEYKRTIEKIIGPTFQNNDWQVNYNLAKRDYNYRLMELLSILNRYKSVCFDKIISCDFSLKNRRFKSKLFQFNFDPHKILTEM